jgi:cold shock CspA family protein
LVGEVVSLQLGYGFIRHPQYPNNLFFHQSDLVRGISFESLRLGMLLGFTPSQGDRGFRASEVALR